MLLFFPLLKGVQERAAIALLFFLFSCGWTHLPPPENQRLVLHALKEEKKPYGVVWAYQGTYEGEPVRFKTRKKIPADRDYRVAATVEEGYLQLDPALPLYPIEGSFSWAEKRFTIKKHAQAAIKARIFHPPSAHLLAALFTGELEDRLIAKQFRDLGLQHLLAISGFHFSLMGWMLALAFRSFLSPKYLTALIATLLTAYFLFLGGSASIARAWIAASLGIAGMRMNLSGSGLSALGVALGILSLSDPSATRSIGFQFSFASTAAILLFYPLFPIDRYFPKRPDWPFSFLSRFFAETMALNLSVMGVALPLALFHFGTFPLDSLLYNLFYPLLISFSMLLFLMGLVFEMLPFVGTLVHLLNTHFTAAVLRLTASARPTSLNLDLNLFELISIFVIILILFNLRVSKNSKGVRYETI